jgi:hypothetical protein
MTDFIIGVFVQWFLTNAIAQVAPLMSNKSQEGFAETIGVFLIAPSEVLQALLRV